MIKPKQPLTPNQALKRAAALCARCEQATGDVSAKLLQWGLGSDEARQVLEQLLKQGFIDDERYARAFVKDRFALNGWGRVKIAHQLRQKGVPDDVIGQAMSLIGDEEYRQRLTLLLQAKWKSLQDRQPRAAWAALMRFAASRGFEAGLAHDCAKDLTRFDVDDD